MVNQTNSTKNFGRFDKNGKRVVPRKVLLFVAEDFHLDEPYHLNSPRNSRVFHTKGKALSWSKIFIKFVLLSKRVGSMQINWINLLYGKTKILQSTEYVTQSEGQG